MPTTFILAGGADVKNPKYWESLNKLFKHREKLMILSCQFSQPDHEWTERFESFKPYFKVAFNKDMEADLAELNTLEQQIINSDVIYLHGGNTIKLMKSLESVENFEYIVRGKTVIGSSAGAQFLSRNYWSCGSRIVGRGKSIVPANVMVHYNSDYGSDEPSGPINWNLAKQELANVSDNEGLILIPEGEFVVFEK